MADLGVAISGTRRSAPRALVKANAVTSGPGDGVPRWGASMRHRPTDRCVRWNGMERATQVDERPAQAREALSGSFFGENVVAAGDGSARRSLCWLAGFPS